MTSAQAPIPLSAADPDTAALSRYLQVRIPQLAGTIDYFRFTGGHANLTYLVSSGQAQFVLKREPGGVKAKSAHDMRREFHMLSRLAPVYPLAPRPVLLCEDEAVFGGVFCVMERIDGIIVRSAAEAGEADIAGRRLLSLIDALAQLHAVDVAAAGLADFGKPHGYRARQVEGWCRRFEQARTENQAAADDVIAWLRRCIPATPAITAVIHNDFKMDNLVWREDPPDRPAGVLDWEMATVGDALMDLACTLSFWVEAGDSAPLRSLRAMPGGQAGAPSRQDALRRYEAASGTAVGDFTFYRCFGLFRRAAIEQQKFFRYVTMQTGDVRYAKLDEAVDILLHACRQLISQAG